MRGSILRRRGPELLVAAGAASLLVVAGLRWVTPLGDHGIWLSNLEAYSRGARLMREIRYPYGPLSVAILHALVRPIGLHVRSVVAVQFGLGLAAAIAIIRFSRRFLSVPERWIASTLLVSTVFWIPGEGSLLYPYAPAVSIGFLFALAAMATSLRASRNASTSFLVPASGLLAGLAYLTKQEIGAAAVLGVGAAWLSACRPGEAVRRGLAAGAVFLATVAVGYAIVFRGTSFLETARANVLWPFAPVPPGWRAQYAGVTGTDRPVESILGVIAAVAACVSVLGASAALLERGSRGRRARALAVAVAGGFAAVAASRFGWIAPFAAVPFGVAAALVLGWKARKTPGAPSLLSLSAASVPLLTRVGWRGWSDGPFTAIGYSFAIPSAVFAGSRLLHALSPSGEGGPNRRRTAAAAATILAILALAFPALLRIGRWPEASVPVAMPRGTVWVPRSWARTLELVRDDILRRTTSRDDVLFLPETHGMSFLLDRGSPAPGLKMDTGWDRGAEAGLVSILETRPPSVIVVFDENAQPFATAGFGMSYGRFVEEWIEPRYTVVLASNQHGVPFRVLAKQDRTTAGPAIP